MNDPLTYVYPRSLDQAFGERGPVVEKDAEPEMYWDDKLMLWGGDLNEAALARTQREQALLAYRWPGNIRQLQNELSRVSALADGDEITLEDLSPAIRAVDRPAPGG